MKIALWMGALLVALLWTGGAWVTASLIDWAAALIASGEAVGLGRAVADWPLPPWIGLWADAALIELLRDAAVWTLEALQATSPVAGGVIGWLVPVVWGVWGLGMAVILALAIGLHWLVSRRGPGAMR